MMRFFPDLDGPRSCDRSITSVSVLPSMLLAMLVPDSLYAAHCLRASSRAHFPSAASFGPSRRFAFLRAEFLP